MITPMDFLCRQNWIDQTIHNVRPYTPSLERTTKVYGWGALDWTETWNIPPGYYSWERRHDYMSSCQRLLSARQSLIR